MIAFRALTRLDLPLVRRWLNTPHVYEWWGRHMGAGALGGTGPAAATEAEVEEKYGKVIDHDFTTHRFIIELDGAAIGLIQWYHLRDSAEYARQIGEDPATSAGIDLFIGDPAAINCGIGSRTIEAFVTSIVFHQSDVTRIVTGPAKTNARSIRAFEKAGFAFVRFASIAGEPRPEAIMVRAKT